jgi:hypothetical protein
MISPLGQRQVFQTAHVEAARQAQEVSEQIQRENAKKRVVDDRLQEDQASVRVVAESGTIQTNERKGGRGAQEQLPKQKAAKDEPNDEDPAESADSHLNFLA